MNLDDPKLTAFALNELDEPERSQIAQAIAESPEAQRAVDETRELAKMLKAEYAAESETQPRLPANLIDIRDDPWFWSIGRPLAIAAVLAVCAVIGAVVFGPHKSPVGSPTIVHLPASESVEIETAVSPRQPLRRRWSPRRNLRGRLPAPM